MPVDFHFESEDLDEHIKRVKAEIPIGKFTPDSLNRLLGGIYRGRFNIFESEPGVGKTTGMGQIADHAAQNGFIVIIATLEIAPHQWIAKSISRLSSGQLTIADVVSGSKPEAFAETLAVYRKTIAPNVIFVEGPIESDDLAALVANVKRETNKPILLLVDYLQVITTNLTDERMAIKDIAYRLRKIANREDIQVIAASSLNRSSYGKAPSIGGSSGSGAIEYSADTVLHMREIRPKGEEDDLSPIRTIEITALKNRYGQKGSVRLLFDTEHATFMER